MAAKVKLEGFRELEKALRELPKSTGKATLRRVARGALEPLAARAAALAPERTGRLGFSIAVSEKRTRRARKEEGKRPDGITMSMGPAAGLGTLNYAAFDEFGTIDTPPQPYMRPAWDAGASGALDYVKENLAAEIGKSADRLARKKAKAAGG